MDTDGLCCDYAEWADCDCDGQWEGECHNCWGAGGYVPDHCCACGGSPYCQCCPTCGASCVGNCTCPLPVTLANGTTLIV